MRGALTFLSNRIRTLRASSAGNVAVIFAIAAVPLIVAVGMGIDVARAYTYRVRIGAALDEAALAVGSTDPTKYTLAQLQQRLQNYFAANFPPAAGVTVTPNMSFDPSSTNIINVSAQATIPTTFMRVIGVDNLTVNVDGQVTRGISGLELALVLDNTGSMLCGDSGMGSVSACLQGTPHITSLVADATEIVQTLFAGTPDASKLRIAIVPYVTAVNVGPALQQAGKLDTYVPSPYRDLSGQQINDAYGKPITYDATQTETTGEWRGCVIEPTSANEDTTGIGPDISEPNGGWTGPWTAYYWPSSVPDNGPKSPWYTTTTTVTGRYPHQTTTTTTKLNINYAHTGDVFTATNNSQGPNLSCPTPLVRLTSDETTLVNAVQGIKAWANSGTMIHVGMAWGWRALSPNPPFADGAPYNTPGWIKAVVLETDGQNDIGNTQLTGLGRLSDGKMGSTNLNTATSHLNSRLQTVCANMKKAGIIIYTIGLGQGATGSTAASLQSCASDPSKFFAAPDAATLHQDFQEIAFQLGKLRLSK